MDILGLEIKIKETFTNGEDGRWEDDSWVEEQAELSACEDMLDQTIVYK